MHRYIPIWVYEKIYTIVLWSDRGKEATGDEGGWNYHFTDALTQDHKRHCADSLDYSLSITSHECQSYHNDSGNHYNNKNDN